MITTRCHTETMYQGIQTISHGIISDFPLFDHTGRVIYKMFYYQRLVCYCLNVKRNKTRFVENHSFSYLARVGFVKQCNFLVSNYHKKPRFPDSCVIQNLFTLKIKKVIKNRKVEECRYLPGNRAILVGFFETLCLLRLTQGAFSLKFIDV